MGLHGCTKVIVGFSRMYQGPHLHCSFMEAYMTKLPSVPVSRFVDLGRNMFGANMQLGTCAHSYPYECALIMLFQTIACMTRNAALLLILHTFQIQNQLALKHTMHMKSISI